MHAVEQAEGLGVREYALVLNVGTNFTNGRENMRLDASEGGGIPNVHGRVHSFVYDATLELLYQQCKGLSRERVCHMEHDGRVGGVEDNLTRGELYARYVGAAKVY
jgi:hypothetical protein